MKCGGPAPRAGTLIDHLKRRIRLDGPLTIAAYMTEALLNPWYGYYTTGDRLGAKGDFITAPEISQMFGEMIGLWLADTWQKIGAPSHVILAELGPGRGTLMADALRAARTVPGFQEAVDLHLVEASPIYQERQAQLLGHAEPTWHRDAGTLPEGPFLFVANEFFDALPIRQLQLTPAGWAERRVAVSPYGDALCLGLDHSRLPASLIARHAPADVEVGSVLELRTADDAVMQHLAGIVAHEGGAGLIIDYGYVGPRAGNTLQAVRGHQPVDILDRPGTADLTAHVDFSLLADACRRSGAVPWGPIDQGAFLTELGITVRADRLRATAEPNGVTEIDRALDRLISKGGMGTLFKVMAVTGAVADPPAGFQSDG